MTSLLTQLLLYQPQVIKDVKIIYNYEYKHQMKKVFKEMMYLFFPKKTKIYWIHIYNIIINEIKMIDRICYSCKKPLSIRFYTQYYDLCPKCEEKEANARYRADSYDGGWFVEYGPDLSF